MLSLTGYLAARYTYEVLVGIEEPLAGRNVLPASKLLAKQDIGVFSEYQTAAKKRPMRYPERLTADGRLIG